MAHACLPLDSWQHANVKNYECHALVNRGCRSSSHVITPSDARRGPDTQALEGKERRARRHRLVPKVRSLEPRTCARRRVHGRKTKRNTRALRHIRAQPQCISPAHSIVSYQACGDMRAPWHANMRTLPPDSWQHATVKNYECHALVNRDCRSSSRVITPSDERGGPDTQALEGSERRAKRHRLVPKVHSPEPRISARCRVHEHPQSPLLCTRKGARLLGHMCTILSIRPWCHPGHTR